MTEKSSAKKTSEKTRARRDAPGFAAPVLDSAREIWLAGLGAVSVAQAESGKLIEQGNKLFEKLVSEGKKLERKTRDAAESAVGDIKGDMGSRVGAVRQQATDNWDKLENIFEDRVARVLGRLGVPTAEEVDKLSERVESLSQRVSALTASIAAGTAKTRKRGAKKTPAKGTAAKPAQKSAAKPPAKTRQE